MGEELAKPILNKKPIDGKTKLFRYGINEVQGWKKTMEVYNTKDNFLGPEKNINVFVLKLENKKSIKVLFHHISNFTVLNSRKL